MNYNDFGQRIDYVEYVVKKGDTLYTIAKKYDTTVASLTDINMLTSNAIFPGQILLVPKGSSKEIDYYFENGGFTYDEENYYCFYGFSNKSVSKTGNGGE